MEFKLPILPPSVELETIKVLKQLVKAYKSLAELKGTAKTIANENILIDTLYTTRSKR